jgi:hypothetical protein
MTNKPPLDELLPCPFCGSSGRKTPIHRFTCSGDMQLQYTCPVTDVLFLSKEQWNTRAANSQEADKDVVDILKELDPTCYVNESFQLNGEGEATDKEMIYIDGYFPKAELMAAIAALPQDKTEEGIDYWALFIAYTKEIEKITNGILSEHMMGVRMDVPEELVDSWLKYFPLRTKTNNQQGALK